MDNTTFSILAILAFIVVAVGLIYLVAYLRKKNIIQVEDINYAVQILKLTDEILENMHLKQEPMIAKISDIIISSLSFVSAKYTDKQQLTDATIQQVEKSCETAGIQITDERKILITQLVTFVLGNSFIQDTNGTYVLNNTKTPVEPAKPEVEPTPAVTPKVTPAPVVTPTPTVTTNTTTTPVVTPDTANVSNDTNKDLNK